MSKERVLEILSYTYGRLKEQLSEVFENNYNDIEEIRIRSKRPVIIKTSSGNTELLDKDLKPLVMSQSEIDKLFDNICENSRYAYMNEICNGYVTINGGHRVGIAGRAVCENGVIHNFTDINSLNIRIASERKGASDAAMKYVLDGNGIKSSLIFAPPMVGKTTVLRDIARQISDFGFKVGITDDRGEIAGMYRGSPQNDIGRFTDVIENAPKSEAIIMLIRCMSPDVIVTDEISTMKECEAVLSAVGTGVKVIGTTHGSNIREVTERPVIKPLIKSGEFSQLLELKRCKNELSIIPHSISVSMLDC